MAHPETFLFSGKYLEKGCETNGFVSLPIFNKHVAELESLARPKDYLVVICLFVVCGYYVVRETNLLVKKKKKNMKRKVILSMA